MQLIIFMIIKFLFQFDSIWEIFVVLFDSQRKLLVKPENFALVYDFGISFLIVSLLEQFLGQIYVYNYSINVG